MRRTLLRQAICQTWPTLSSTSLSTASKASGTSSTPALSPGKHWPESWPRMNPGITGAGNMLKRQLVRAAIAATRAVREVEPEARFIMAEPLINVICHGELRWASPEAEAYRLAQFEAVDLL